MVLVGQGILSARLRQAWAILTKFAFSALSPPEPTIILTGIDHHNGAVDRGLIPFILPLNFTQFSTCKVMPGRG